MSDANKNAVRRLVEEVWNKGNLPVADQLFAPIYTHHDTSSPDLGRGPESEKLRATLYRTAFPDIRLTIEDLIAEGETVTARWSCRGTHKGDLSGIAPTGKSFTITGTSTVRFATGKMVEGWINWDALGMMQQLGVVPVLAKAKVAAAAASAN
jgi:predicted SnoaL-like aldol condensation-catalyzing enzyme